MNYVSLSQESSPLYSTTGDVPKKSALKRSFSFTDSSSTSDMPSIKRTVSFGDLEVVKYSIYNSPLLTRIDNSIALPLKESESDPKKYYPRKFAGVPLAEVKDHPRLCIRMISNTIQKTWYGTDNDLLRFNGEYITSLLESALSSTTPEKCLDWLTSKVGELRCVTDLLSPRQFDEIRKGGWLTLTKEIATLFDEIKNGTWPQNQEREVKVHIPDLETHLRSILAIPDVKEAIKCFFTTPQLL